LNPGGLFHRPLVRWAQQASAVGSGTAEHALELQTGDHIGHAAIPHGIFPHGRINAGGTGGQDDGADGLLAVAGFPESVEHGRHLGEQDCGFEGLDQVVDGPDFHGIHGGFHGGVSGHHHHLEIGLDHLGLFQHRHTAHARHLDVQQHEMKG
jgi:hypothetical protein